MIKYLNHGIACRIGDDIYINKRLLDYPNLFKRILLHEKAHSSSFNRDDLILDLDNSHLEGVKREYYNFILTHPSSWTEFLPFGFYEKRFIINPLISMFWAFGIFLIFAIIKSI